MSILEELNQRFSIPGVARIIAGKNGLPKVSIETPAATAEIYLHGAQLTSWRPAAADEVIFLSGQSQFQAGRAIRGGVPICFPWFRERANDPKTPSHGFVRTKSWQLDSIERSGDEIVVSLSTESDAAARAWWAKDFRLVHRVTIGGDLGHELIMTNTGATPLRFEEALHTYFRVGGAESIRIRGLDDAHYLDNTDGNREKWQEGDIVFIAQTDRVYLDTTHAVEILDPILRRRILLSKENSRTTVVWNPWSTGARSLSDLGDDEWRWMACVEASNIRAFSVDLPAGAQHTMKTRIQVTAASEDTF